MTETTTPKVWIGSLHAYNCGHLIGDWIDIEEGDEAADIEERARAAIREQVEGIAELNADDCTDELAAFDHEGLAPLVDGEPDIAEAVQAAAVLAQVGEDDQREAFLAWWVGSDVALEDAAERFADEFYGEFDSDRHFAEEIAGDAGVFEGLSHSHPARVYFNFDAYARDLMMSGFHSAPSGRGSVYVFRAT